METLSNVQIATELVKNEINVNGCITRKKAISIYMKKMEIKELNGSVVSTIDKVIRDLKKAEIIKTKEKGLYIKI
jgi:hypothetical protein